MWEFGRASDAEGLELMLAFFNITEPQKRREVIAFAEKLARESVPVALLPVSLPQDNSPKDDSPLTNSPQADFPLHHSAQDNSSQDYSSQDNSPSK
jgi:hypothetical protein